MTTFSPLASLLRVSGRRLLVVGGINQDVVVRVGRRPGVGETVVGNGPAYVAGGKGANTAVAAARAGAVGVEVALCGAVGRDAAGDEQIRELVQAGVDVTAVTSGDDVPTGVAMIVVTPDGENSIAVGAGANATLDVDEVVAAARGADVVLAQTEVGGSVTDAAAAAISPGARFVLSLAPVVDVAPATLAAAHPLVLNESEAAELGATDADELRRATGARSVVVTLGARGAVVADADGTTTVPSAAVEVVDTTGAGDVLAGTLAAYLASGLGLVDALRLAVAAAAEAVTRPGAR